MTDVELEALVQIIRDNVRSIGPYDKIDYSLAALDELAARARKLEAAEKVAEALDEVERRSGDLDIGHDCWAALQAWRRAKGKKPF